MQSVAEEAKLSAGHTPELPVQVSATSHVPADARHTVLDDLNTSTHVLAVPEQWSAMSLSQAPACDAPVQVVADDRKTSVGQVPVVPVHVSATSHCPADPRHVKLDAWKTSTHAPLVPVQWSAASLSHAPLCDVPVHSVADDAKTSTHVLAVPKQ